MKANLIYADLSTKPIVGVEVKRETVENQFNYRPGQSESIEVVTYKGEDGKNYIEEGNGLLRDELSSVGIYHRCNTDTYIEQINSAISKLNKQIDDLIKNKEYAISRNNEFNSRCFIICRSLESDPVFVEKIMNAESEDILPSYVGDDGTVYSDITSPSNSYVKDSSNNRFNKMLVTSYVKAIEDAIRNMDNNFSSVDKLIANRDLVYSKELNWLADKINANDYSQSEYDRFIKLSEIKNQIFHSHTDDLQFDELEGAEVI